MIPGRRGRVRPEVLGHRGGEGGPQNSLEAVRAAIELGADGVEIDIQVDPSGEPVAGHDMLDPARSGARSEQAERADPLPLRELLSVVDEAGITLLIDFKSGGDPTEEAAALAEVLVTVPRPELVTVSSFSVPFLCRFGPLAPDFPLVPIVSLRQNFPSPGQLERWAGASVLAAALVANPMLTFRLRRRGARLLVWFGATEWPPMVRAAVRLGADAVIVAKVGRTLDMLGRRHSS
jgi:glycerophosphoryl diester phosphodiesterase